VDIRTEQYSGCKRKHAFNRPHAKGQMVKIKVFIPGKAMPYFW